MIHNYNNSNLHVDASFWDTQDVMALDKSYCINPSGTRSNHVTRNNPLYSGDKMTLESDFASLTAFFQFLFISSARWVVITSSDHLMLIILFF